jgi:hypothetical protein
MATAVQLDNGTEVLLAVSAPPRSGRPSVTAVRRRRARRVLAIWRRDVVVATPPSAPEPEDHWDDGARASLAMVGVTYRG